MLQSKWWHNKSLHSWHFWQDPYSEVRVSEIHNFNTYYWDRPTEEMKVKLREKGWDYVQGPIDAFRSSNEGLVKETFNELGLPVPSNNYLQLCNRDWWNAKMTSNTPIPSYCYRVYWRETMFYI
jgi:hypothetical protein